jgi:hypothetical protein
MMDSGQASESTDNYTIFEWLMVSVLTIYSLAFRPQSVVFLHVVRHFPRGDGPFLQHP